MVNNTNRTFNNSIHVNFKNEKLALKKKIQLEFFFLAGKESVITSECVIRN